MGPSAMTGRPGGSKAAARARSSGAVQAIGSGGGSSPRIAPSSSVLWPERRRHIARLRVGTRNERPVPLMSTTKSQTVRTVVAQSGSQCRPYGRLSRMIVRSRLGIRANTPSATRPHTTVIRASGCTRMRWSSRPVDRTASPTRLEVTNRIRIEAAHSTSGPAGRNGALGKGGLEPGERVFVTGSLRP